MFPGTAHPASTNRLGDGQFLHMGANDSFLQDHLQGVNFSQWPTLAVTWVPGKITWYLNGKPTWTVPRSDDRLTFACHGPVL